jgi:hypothetical protein
VTQQVSITLDNLSSHLNSLERGIDHKQGDLRRGLEAKIDAMADLLAKHLASVGSPRSTIRAAQQLKSSHSSSHNVLGPPWSPPGAGSGGGGGGGSRRRL